jgi:pimeloyl-ACP methyl ester carboxylesterase
VGAARGRHRCLAIAIVVIAFVTMPSMASARAFSGPVEVANGRELYVECRGGGAPTVVLISGKGNGARDWHQVLDASDPVRDVATDEILAGKGDLHDSTKAVLPTIARRTRVCAYDRPNTRAEGKDLSTPREQPHSVDEDVDDLHRALEQIGAREPYVLVAHSYGGFVAELFARRYPDEVGGVVMVDAGSSYIARAVSAEKLSVWDRMNRIAAPGQESVELADAVATLDAAPPLHPMPAVVLTADKRLRAELQPADADAGVTFDDWLVGQDLMAAGLDARHVTKTDSGHNIYLYSPRLVNTAIRDVVAAVRRGNGR